MSQASMIMGWGCTALLLAGWAPLGHAPDTAVRCLAAPPSCGTDSVHPICASGTGSGVCLHGAGWRPNGQYLLDASDLRSAGRSDAVTGAGVCPTDTVPSDCVCPTSRADLSARDEASDPPTDLTVEVESAVGFTISELCYTTNIAKASEADARAPSGSSWWQGCGGDSGVGFAVACPQGSEAAEVLPAAAAAAEGLSTAAIVLIVVASVVGCGVLLVVMNRCDEQDKTQVRQPGPAPMSPAAARRLKEREDAVETFRAEHGRAPTEKELLQEISAASWDQRQRSPRGTVGRPQTSPVKGSDELFGPEEELAPSSRSVASTPLSTPGHSAEPPPHEPAPGDKKTGRRSKRTKRTKSKERCASPTQNRASCAKLRTPSACRLRVDTRPRSSRGRRASAPRDAELGDVDSPQRSPPYVHLTWLGLLRKARCATLC
eukprot:COSAG04_NODE_2835_length_3512_cov_1.795781_4_plen_433_part_00